MQNLDVNRGPEKAHVEEVAFTYVERNAWGVGAATEFMEQELSRELNSICYQLATVLQPSPATYIAVIDL